MSHAVVERLPNGWSKKAVKRLTGIAKGNLLRGIDNCSGVARSVVQILWTTVSVKVPFFQKVRFVFQISQSPKNIIPKNYPELEI